MSLSFDDYVAHDALGLAALVSSGQASAVEVLECAIARAEAVNPAINAIAAKLYDRARGEAGKASSGPLAGVPFALKDLNHPVKGAALTHGSRAFAGAVAPADGETARRVRAAGVTIFATTTSPEFGITTTTESALHGKTRNPWNLERSSGGSSGGASALVAAGVVPAAHATDGGGSIRVPASACGLFGLKPSRGRTPSGHGRTEGWNGLGVSHAVTRSVRDSAALLDATAGPEPGSRYVAPPPLHGGFLDAVDRAPPRLKIALQTRPFAGGAVDPAVMAALHDAARLCEDLGHHVEEAQPDLDGAALSAAMGRVVMVHTAAALDGRAAALGRPLREDEMEPVTSAFVHMGRQVTGMELAACDVVFMEAAIAMALFMERYEVVLSPTLAQPPAPLGWLSLDRSPAEYGAAIGAYSPFTAIHNQTGQPAMSAPLAWSDDGLPIGLQFAGRLGAEELLFSLAAELERARPWFARRPKL